MIGKLIVIDGVDASGKKTQALQIYNLLKEKYNKVAMISFPSYDKEYSAPVRMYLGGEFGENPDCVNPYAASTFYAVDRFCSYRTDWGKLLDDGYIIISDRYTTSNAIHQGVKFNDIERKDYFKWLYDLEFNKMQLPKPDMVVFLNMPPEISLELMKKRYNNDETKKDIHEKDSSFIFSSHKNACEASEFLGWNEINCVDENGIKSIARITDEIIILINEKLKI